MRRLDDTMDSMDMSLSKLRETVKEREAWRVAILGSQRVRHDLATEHHQQKPVVPFRSIIPWYCYGALAFHDADE